MKYLKTYEGIFSKFNKIKPNPQPQSVIDSKEVKQVIKDGLIELEDDEYTIRVKENKSNLYQRNDGEISFGKERKIISVSIGKWDTKGPVEFKMGDVKDIVLSTVDMIKSEFKLSCSFYFSTIKTAEYKQDIEGFTVDDDDETTQTIKFNLVKDDENLLSYDE